MGADCSNDCDDTDPSTTVECGTDCGERPDRLGCPCSAGEPALCFRGPVDANGQGACQPGLQQCVDGVLGPCEGQVLPRPEQCDGQDEDCDGHVDDGVTNECGTCGDCREGACFGAGADCIAWSAGRLDHVLEVEDRSLMLARLANEERVVWTTHKGNSIAYKVDPATRAILGAYRTSDEEVEVQSTTVDREGNFVLPHHRGSSVTRIARDESACPDRNGDGIVDTSHSADELLAWDSRDEWEDECILWHAQVPLGASTVALHESYGPDSLVERVWVGIDDDLGVAEIGFVELDLATGETTGRSVPTPGFGPIGSAVDDRGRIWAVANTSALGVFDPGDRDPTIEYHAADASLVIVATDESGYVWVRGGGLQRYDPEADVFESVYEEWEREQGLAPWGGLLAADGEGSIWEIEELPDAYRIDAATLEFEALDFGDVLAPYGVVNVGVDFLRQLWVLAPWVPGASIYDFETAEITLALDDCGEVVCENAAANGDFTGLPWTLVQPERGVWTDDVVACAEGDEVVWTRLRATAAIPSGSRVSLMVRTGADDVDLWTGEWLLAGALVDGDNELDLTTLLGDATRLDRLFALQARLEADRAAESAVLSGVEVSWGCQIVQ
jgi:streptogramin lyase